MKTNQIYPENKPDIPKSKDKKIFLIFTATLVIGIIGLLIFGHTNTGHIFAHVGGLGIIGLLASLTGIVARKKNYNYRKIFLLAFFLPIILGLIVVVIVFITNGIVYCGGGVSLAVAVIILISILLIRRRKKQIKN